MRIKINVLVKFRVAGMTLGTVKDSFVLPEIPFFVEALLPAGETHLVNNVRGVSLSLTKTVGVSL